MTICIHCFHAHLKTSIPYPVSLLATTKLILKRLNVHGVNKINSFYKSLYENTVFEGVHKYWQKLSSPTIVSNNIANIEYLAGNFDGKSAEILFHVNNTVYVNDSVKEINFTIYDKHLQSILLVWQ